MSSEDFRVWKSDGFFNPGSLTFTEDFKDAWSHSWNPCSANSSQPWYEIAARGFFSALIDFVVVVPRLALGIVSGGWSEKGISQLFREDLSSSDQKTVAAASNAGITPQDTTPPIYYKFSDSEARSIEKSLQDNGFYSEPAGPQCQELSFAEVGQVVQRGDKYFQCTHYRSLFRNSPEIKLDNTLNCFANVIILRKRSQVLEFQEIDPKNKEIIETEDSSPMFDFKDGDEKKPPSLELIDALNHFNPGVIVAWGPSHYRCIGSYTTTSSQDYIFSETQIQIGNKMILFEKIPTQAII